MEPWSRVFKLHALDDKGETVASEETRAQASTHGLIPRRAAVWRGRLRPAVGRWLVAFYSVVCRRLISLVGRGSLRITGELLKIHRQRSWMHRAGTTLSGNAAGLGMAMLSTRLVENMVEKREFSNLWGVFAERPVVSETTFEMLSFGVEFLLGLVVFSVTEYYMAEYRRRRQPGTETVAAEGDESL